MTSLDKQVVEAFEAELDKKIKQVSTADGKETTHLAEVLRVDNDGTIWVHIYGGAVETPVRNSAVTVDKGDVVHVVISNGSVTISSNMTYPVTSQSYVDNMAGAVSSQVTQMANGVYDKLTAQDATIGTLTAGYANINELVAGKADIAVLEAEYAHITEGVIDNATIDHADVNDLDANYAHITEGVIDNATIDHADVNDLDAHYAHITQGVIDNATIDHADVNDLDAHYAHITQGVIDNATIGYADVNDLDANYANIGLANVDTAYIDHGVIRAAAIVDEQVFTVTGNKATLAKLDASKINVYNLRAENLIVSKINGQPVLGNYEAVNENQSGYSSKNPSQEGWYEFSASGFVLSTDTTVDTTKAYFTKGTGTKLYDQAYIDDLAEGLNQRIDGAIETWTGTAVPTMVTYPVSEWSQSEYDNHVGDIYYVVNTASDEDGFCYRFAYDNTSQQYGWVLIKDSDVTKALQDITDLQDFESDTTSWIEETDEGLRTIRQNHTALAGVVDKTVKDTVQLWYTKANTTAPSKPTAKVTSTSTAGNAWRVVVPAWNASYPNYYFCYQMELADGTFAWSDVVRDIAMGESQGTSRDAQTKANADIQSSVQLWYTSNSTTPPAAPSAEVTSTATTANQWTTKVPTYASATPKYHYCYQQKKGDGTFQWTTPTYDDATTTAMAKAQAALPSSTFTTFQTTTFKELVDEVDEQGVRFDTMSEKVETIANPNLSPFFSMPLDDLYDASDNVDGYWRHSSVDTRGTALADGWALVELDNTSGTSTAYVLALESKEWRTAAGPLKPSTDYTMLVEYRNASVTGTVTMTALSSVTSSYPGMFGTVPAALQVVDGAYHVTGTTRSDFSSATNTTRTVFSVTAGASLSVEVRLSLYEGDYSGPYKPYVVDNGKVVTLSNTVNDVRSTASANYAHLSQLTQTLGTNEDGTTKADDIVHKYNHLDQTLDGTINRVGAVETDLVTVANPNLTPWFTAGLKNSDYWHTLLVSSYTPGTDHTDSEGLKYLEYLEDGWVHVKQDSRSSAGNQSKSNYINTWVKLDQLPVEEGKTYTWVAEIRNLQFTGGTTSSYLGIYPSIGNATLDKLGSVNNAAMRITASGDYVLRRTATAKSDFSSLTQDTRGYMVLTVDSYAEYDLRVGLFEGSYSGPYKPYVDQTLSTRVTQAETSIEQNAEDITLRATKSVLAQSARSLLANTTSPVNETYSYAKLSKCDAFYRWAGSSTLAKTDDGVRMDFTANNQGMVFPLVDEDCVAPGETVTLSFTYRGTLATTGNVFFIRTPTPNSSQANAATLEADGEWHDMTMTWDVIQRSNETGTAYALLLFYGTSNGKWVEVKDGSLRLERGDTRYASQAELKVANDEISARVEKDGVIAAINLTSESAKIQANRVEIDGTTTFSSGGTLASYVEGKASDAVDALEIGGTNLLLDTSDEVTVTSPSSTDVYTRNWTLSDRGMELMDGNTTDTFVWTFDYEVVGNAATNAVIYQQIKGAIATNRVSGNAISLNVYDNPSGRYSLVCKLSATQAASTTKTCRIGFRYATEGATLRVWNVKCERGNVATAWSPAPEDQTAYVDDSVNNIDVSGVNILPATRDWYGANKRANGTYAVTSDTYGGCAVISQTWGSGNCDLGYTGNVWTQPIEADTWYTLSFWAKASEAVSLYSYFFSTNSVDEGYNSSGKTTTSADGAIENDITTEWQRLWVTWHIKAGATAFPQQLIITRIQSAQSSATVYVAGPKLEKGNKASAWSPAPEDSMDTANLLKASDATLAPSAYNVAVFHLSEPVVAEQMYTLTLWDVDISNTGSNPYLGVYYSGGSVRLGGFSVANNFTDGHADKLTMTFVAHLSAVTTIVSGSSGVGASGNFSSVASVADPRILLYNDPQSGAANLTVGKWKLEKGNKSSGWSLPPEDTVLRTQRVYYRSKVSGTVPAPTTWIVETANQYNDTVSAGDSGWSAKVTPIANGTGASATKYLYLYTCEQREMGDGTLRSTSVLLDDSTTVIDGGKIITGSIEANKVSVTDLQAFGATIGGFDIDATSIHTKDVAVTSNADNSIGLSSSTFTRTVNGTSRANLKLAIGSKFGVDKAGNLYANGAYLTGIQIGNTDLVIGGTNLLRNTSTPVSKAVNTTSYATQALYATDGNNNADDRTLADLGFAVGDSVTLSFDWSVSANGSNAMTYGTFRMELYGTNGTNTNTYITPFPPNPAVTMSASNTSGHWENSLVLTASTVLTKRIVLRVDASVLTVKISNMKLERGNVATSWSPHPDDVEYSVSSAAASASAAASSATSASTSANTASTKATAAATSATNAATSASTASTKASEASTSATNAATSASTASTKASEASTSASTASTKATAAANSATAAANSATAAAEVMGGYTILWNYEAFATANNGEGFICAFDPATGKASDANGWVKWEGTKRTITKVMLNPNTVLPYNIPIYVVARLGTVASPSATSTTATNVFVWYNSGWKYAVTPTPSAVGGAWDWNAACDIILGKFVEPSSEAAFTDCEIYNPPWSAKQVTTDTITARSANAAASAAQTTANNANTAAGNAQATANTALADSVEYISGTHGTDATNVWTGVTRDASLVAGKTIAFKMTSAGTSTAATLNLTLSGGGTTGAKALRRNNSTVTTQFAVGSVLMMTYDGTYWRITGLGSDTNTYDRTQYKASVTANAAIAAGRLGVFDTSGKLILLSTTAFDITKPILYVGTAYTDTALTQTNNYTFWGTPFALTNTHAITGAAAGAAVYIIGTLNGTTFTPDSAVFTCTKPSNAASGAGKVYMHLGFMSTAANAVLEAEHPLYMFFDGKFQQCDPATASAACSATNYIYTDSSNAMHIASANPGTQKQELVMTSSYTAFHDSTGAMRNVIDSSGMDILDTDGETSVAKFGSSVRVGKESETYISLGDGAIAVTSGANGLLYQVQPSASSVTDTMSYAYTFDRVRIFDDSVSETVAMIPLDSVPSGSNFKISVMSTYYMSSGGGMADETWHTFKKGTASTVTLTQQLDNSTFTLAYAASGNYGRFTLKRTAAATSVQYAASDGWKRVSGLKYSKTFIAPSFQFGTVNEQVTDPIGGFSSVMGRGLTAIGDHMFVCGKFNATTTNAAFVVGNGGGIDGGESDALKLDWNGNLTLGGTIASGSIPTLAVTKVSALVGHAYGTCSIAAATAAKTVTCSGFVLTAGARVAVKFTYANSHATPTLNVNSTGAKGIRCGSSTAVGTGEMWAAGEVVEFIYDGTYWQIQGRHAVLYDNATGSNSSVTLAKAITNYSHLRIFFRENQESAKSSIDVYSPANGDRVSLIAVGLASDGATYQVNAAPWYFSSTTALRYASTSKNAYINVAGTSSGFGTQAGIYVTRVEAWS